MYMYHIISWVENSVHIGKSALLVCKAKVAKNGGVVVCIADQICSYVFQYSGELGLVCEAITVATYMI